MQPAVPVPASGGVGTAAQLMQDNTNNKDDDGNDGTDDKDGNSNTDHDGRSANTDHDGRSAKTNHDGHCAKQQHQEQGPTTMRQCSSSLDVPSDCARNSQGGNTEHKDIQRTAKTASAHNGKQQIRTRCERPLDDSSDRTNDPNDDGNQSHIQRTGTLPWEQEQWATIMLVPVL